MAATRVGATRRWGLSAACALHALVFAAIGVLVFRPAPLVGSALAALALSNAATALAAVAALRWLPKSWLIQSLLALSGLGGLACLWFGAVGYLCGVYDGLGSELVSALVALFGIAVTLLLPLAAWGLAENASMLAGRERSLRVAVALLVLAPLGACLWGNASGRVEAVPALSASPPDGAALAELVSVQSSLPRQRGRLPQLISDRPVQCEAPITTGNVSLVASFLARARRGGVESVCVQARELPGAVELLAASLRARARLGPITLDVIRGSSSLSHGLDWLDALKLRPGLDGICHERRCLMPWQLLSQGVFSTYRPMAAIPDFQFGVDPASLRRALDEHDSRDGLDGLIRVVTDSYVLEGGRLVALARLRRRDVAVSAESVHAAELAAEQHVLDAQLDDGKFRYTLDPFNGAADTQGFNLPRQAGVTLALCELGSDSARVRAAIERSLGMMQGNARRRGNNVGLGYDPGDARVWLGPNALPLVAFLRCSARVAFRYDAIIAELARLLLRLEREDGGFYPGYDLEQDRVLEGKDPLYTAGQAVLALVLLEARQRARPSSALPDVAALSAAVERAMQYYGTRYWSHPLRDFFFLEENWHCLAARAALDVHPNRAYEDFCLDYVRFKSRLILEASSGVAADFDGGFGFGNLVPPHNTGAAGTGEALAAAVAVKRRRGLDTRHELAQLERLLGFLMRQQWSADNCFVCRTQAVRGGLSEHTHSALTRIDYAQHAWAAIGHGGRALGLVDGARSSAR
jgi:hypothetical protein